MAELWRKKPVTVEAMRYHGNIDDVAAWIEAGGGTPIKGGDGTLFVDTLEGRMRADHGDWIIRGVQGEFYPCKSDIFFATYELLV